MTWKAHLVGAKALPKCGATRSGIGHSREGEAVVHGNDCKLAPRLRTTSSCFWCIRSAFSLRSQNCVFLLLFTSEVPGVLASINIFLSYSIPSICPTLNMHFQIFILALVAPLALSLPQPVPQGESGALVARQESGNFTGGGEGEHRKGRHHGPPEGPHPERALVGRQESGNSTGGGVHGHPSAKDNKYDSGNSTGAAGKGYHGGPPYPERERQESGNCTSGGESHGKGENYHEEGHPGPKIDKRIEEINGTTGGYTGTEKLKPDGHHGGPQRPGEHKRSIIDMVLDRRQDNSTSSGEGGREKHDGKKGHLEHKRPE